MLHYKHIAMQEFLQHVKEDPENEVCGIIYMSDFGPRYKRCKNIHPETKHNFKISNEIILNNDVIAVCHSHPNATEEIVASSADIKQRNAMGLPWVIASPHLEMPIWL